MEVFQTLEAIMICCVKTDVSWKSISFRRQYFNPFLSCLANSSARTGRLKR